jgi:hypothetical protein
MMDIGKPREDTRVDKMVECKLSHNNEEQVVVERAKPDFFIPLRNDLNDEIKRSRRANAIRKTFENKPKVDPRLRIIHEELTKRKAKTKDGMIPLRGVYPLPPGFHEVTNELKRLNQINAIRHNYEYQIKKDARLHAIHEELSSKKPRSNRREPPRGTKPYPADKEILRSNRVKSKYDTDPRRRITHIDFTGSDLQEGDSVAPLKGRPHYVSKGGSTSRSRSRSPSVPPPPRRNRSSLIPKKSPLARFKKQWDSSRSLNSSNGSCCSSIDSMDDEYLNTPSTHSLQVELDCNVEEKNESKSKLLVSDGMDLTELALSLSSLVSTAFDNGTFEPTVLRRTSSTTDTLGSQGGTAARSA